MLFKVTSFISNDLGIKQVVQEAIEIKIKISWDTPLNRDMG